MSSSQKSQENYIFDDFESLLRKEKFSLKLLKEILEAPLACRNFIQLALEGYYDNTLVHRVIKGFMVQMGDPTGTGTG
eukprot:gene38223-50137_t